MEGREERTRKRKIKGQIEVIKDNGPAEIEGKIMACERKAALKATIERGKVKK